MELFEKLEGLPGRRRPAIPCKLGWIRAFRPGPAVPWWDSTGPDSTETRYLVRDTGPGPRFPGSGPWFRYHHRPGIEGFSARLSY